MCAQRQEEHLGELSGKRSEADGESQESICDGRGKDQPNLLTVKGQQARAKGSGYSRRVSASSNADH